MTVQPIDRNAPAALASLPPGVSNIVKWATDLATAAQAVELIIDTPFIPVSFWPLPAGVAIRDFPNPSLKHPRESDEEHVRRRRGAIAAAASAVVYGDEIGLTAQAALTSVYVVRGRPGLYAEAMVALVKSHGHDVAVEELTDRVCRMRARRKGEQDWQRFEFTIDRARRAGYDKGNPKYGSDPQAMLYPRCASITCRTVFPDVLKGLASVEDLLDEPDPSAPAVNGTRMVQRSRAAAAAVEAPPAPAERPPLPDEQPGETGYVTPPIDPKTWDAINARFRELGGRTAGGTGSQVARLQVISAIVDRTIAKGSDLTAAEGDLVLSTLQGTTADRLAALVGTPAAPEPAPEPAGPPLPGEQDPPADPWGINDAGGTDADDDIDEQLDVPGDES
jgi:hypothetical protein